MHAEFQTSRMLAALAVTASCLASASAINIHVVPHTHDDVGWLKTVDQYYLGKNQSIYHAGVQYILSSVVSALQENPDRKFTYVEQAFFQRWYSEQTPARQAVVSQLVANGQLTFANGGWCMHDEANPDYVSMIDQQALGVRWVVSEFGPAAAPTVQWQLDPFGHSATQGSLFSSPLSGFTSVVWARISYDDRANRAAEKSLEWVWQPSKSLGSKAMTLAHTLRYHYSAPDNNCYDAIECNGGEAINDDKNLEQYDAPAVAADFINFLDSYSSFYRGNDVLVLFGDDFNYEEGQSYLLNIDKLIKATNQFGNGTYHAMYSSPSQWAEAQLGSGTSFPLRTDDLMPYADGGHSYWGGYFTSRAALKGYVRTITGYQTAVRQLQVLAGGATDLSPTNPLYTLERAGAVAQHHDAVAGTSKQHVADDYALRLANGVAAADAFVAQALAQVTGDAALASTVTTCHLSNVSLCAATEAGVPVLLSIHNPESLPKAQPVRVPVGLPTGVASWAVYGPDGKAVTAQLLPLSAADLTLRGRYGAPTTTNTQWLAFVPSVPIPAAGFAVYFLVPSASAEAAPLTHPSKVTLVKPEAGLRGKTRGSVAASIPTITNGNISLIFDSVSGKLTGYVDVSTGINMGLTQNFEAYLPNTGDSTDGQKSGAYIFRPATQSSNGLATTASLQLVTGPVVSEARQTYATATPGWVSQAIRLWAAAVDVEAEWTIGPIDISNQKGLEVITKYSAAAASGGAPWATAGAWDTDSNCRDWQHRMRNARPSWNLTLSEPVAQNYVPVNCAIRTVDSASGNVLTVVVDRSQGGSSLQDGSIEVMLHRRLLNDDGRGVGEALNETGVDGNGLVVRGRHWLSVQPAASAARVHRARMQSGLLGTGVQAFAPLGSDTPSSWLGKYKASASALASPLPANVHLVTLQSQGPKTVLVRLGHLFETGEDAALSGNVTVGLANLLAGTTITAATELTLVASKPLADVQPVTYRIDGQAPVTLPMVPPAPTGPGLSVTLAPMEIRTFMCTTA